MSRGIEQRVSDVRRLLVASKAVYADRVKLAPVIARTTGLTTEGVELGFESIEREASDRDLYALVSAAGTALHAHVILSANVFVAPLRALVMARAAADRVTVRPSPRDPELARALVDAVRDDAIEVIEGRDVAALPADEIHVYGRAPTIFAVRARARPGVRIRSHGAGLGMAMVTLGADVAASAALVSADVVPFDQRGCLSPKIVVVEGDEARARSFAIALDECLDAWQQRVPRGALLVEERGEVARWIETMAFAGRVWARKHHAVALASIDIPWTIPPAGRHVHVVAAPSLELAAARLSPLEGAVVAIGTDDPVRIAVSAPAHARISHLGRMQRPALDGFVDRRP